MDTPIRTSLTILRLALASLFASALVVACTSFEHAYAAEAAQDKNSAANQAARIVERWTIIVSNRFESSRAFKSDATDELIDQFLSGGAVRAVTDKAGEDKLRDADQIVDRFTAAVIRAGDRHEDGSTEVNDAAVMSSIKSTCPVYPFC